MNELDRGSKGTAIPRFTKEFGYVPTVGPLPQQSGDSITQQPQSISDLSAKIAATGFEAAKVLQKALKKNSLTSKVYTHAQYKKLLEETIKMVYTLSELKGGEYAGDDDRLANFRRNAANLGVNAETVWAVYAGKHWDAISQYVKDLQAGKTRERMESIAGRADDLIVYAILFKALLEDREDAVHQV